jgi:L-alanine-DL-glutamate epimerase-like enolase superfamily enzyme
MKNSNFKTTLVDVLMSDFQHIGDLSEFRRIAAIAASYDVPVSSHLFTEYSICVAASEANCISIEHMPWFAPLYNEPVEIDDGFIQVPGRPGSGFTFNSSAIETYKLKAIS